MKSKLYIQFRVEVDARANQDLVHEIADVVQDRLWDMFECDPSDGPVPKVKEITYEVIMEVDMESTDSFIEVFSENHPLGLKKES